MNKIIKRLKVITILFLFIVPVSYGQDTTYYTNDDLKLLSKAKADYYEVTKAKDIHSSKMEVCGYFISGKKKTTKAITIINNYNVVLKNEKPIWAMDDEYREWFENGKLKKTMKYSNGNIVGELRTYWENGNIKRKDEYEDAEKQFLYEKFIDGKCYNVEGKKIAYFPYFQAAKFPGGPDSLKVFISRNIKNDLTDSLNYTNVNFFINLKGEISNAQINKKNVFEKAVKNGTGIDTKKMEAEAIRVILSMPNWNPALVDGEPANQYKNENVMYGKIFNQVRIYSLVEKMPQYKGGESAVLEFISRNLSYPTLAREKGISGKVILRFVVTKTGSIGEVTVLRGIDSECDEEAIRVIKSLSNWIPGTQNGVPVNVYIVSPIIFKLQ